MFDKNRNYKILNSKVEILNNIVNDINDELEIDFFKEEINSFIKDVNELEFSKIEPNYSQYIRVANSLIKKYKQQFLPLNNIIKNIKCLEENLDVMTEKTRKADTIITKDIIDKVKRLNNTNVEVTEKVLKRLVDTLYHSMLLESMFDKYDTYEYLLLMSAALRNKNNYIEEIKNNLVNKILSELKNHPSCDELMESYDTNYLERPKKLETIIKEIGLLSYSEKNEKYNQNKRTAAMEIYNEYDEINRTKQELDEYNKERKSKVKNLSVRLSARILLVSAVTLVGLSIVALPTWGCGYLKRSNRIQKKFFDNVTPDKIVSDGIEPTSVEEIFEEKNDYEMKFKVIGGWKDNEYGPGYIRYVSTYSCSISDITNEKDCLKEAITSMKLDGVETEATLVLDENASFEDKYEVTEYIVEKDHYRLHIGTTICGFLIGVLLLFSTCAVSAEKLDDLGESIKDLFKELKNVEKWKVVKKRYEQINDRVVSFENEHEVAIDRYDVEKVITPELVEEAKTYYLQRNN